MSLHSAMFQQEEIKTLGCVDAHRMQIDVFTKSTLSTTALSRDLEHSGKITSLSTIVQGIQW